MFNNVFQAAIYYVELSVNPYHLVLENTDNDKENTLVLTASSPQELYSKAFDIAHSARKKNLLKYAVSEKDRVEQQEKISLGVGKGYLHRGEQQKATYHFSRANEFFKKRTVLENEILNLLGLKISQANFVKPVDLNHCMS